MTTAEPDASEMRPAKRPRRTVDYSAMASGVPDHSRSTRRASSYQLQSTVDHAQVTMLSICMLVRAFAVWSLSVQAVNATISAGPLVRLPVSDNKSDSDYVGEEEIAGGENSETGGGNSETTSQRPNKRRRCDEEIVAAPAPGSHTQHGNPNPLMPSRPKHRLLSSAK